MCGMLHRIWQRTKTAWHKQVAQTTPLSDSERTTITHPFHPKVGKTYTVVGVRKHYGKERLLCRDTDNSEFYVPVDYTSAAQNGEAVNQAGADCDFRYEDLLSLLDIIDGISDK